MLMAVERMVKEKDAKALEFIDDVTKNCDKVLEKVSMEILSRKADVEYLKRHRLEGKTDHKSFKSRIPIAGYEDIQPDIQRIGNGDFSCILSAHPISEFLTGSGTSGGERKLMPTIMEDLDSRQLLYNLLMPVMNLGYVEAVREIERQLPTLSGPKRFDDIVVACGSGGTIAGLALGSQLSSLKAEVHAFAVCDDPDYFYDYVQGLIDGLNSGSSSRDIVNIQNAKGIGYAMNTIDELKFVKEVANATGVILDPVYSGKAAFGLMKDMTENPKKWEGRKILFIHTGGLLGLYDKVDQLAPMVGNWQKMEINESIPRQDGIGKMF